MSQALRLSDLLQLQFSTIEQLDQEVLNRLTPVLESAENQLRAELDRFATDTFSYTQRRQKIHLINRALAKIYNQHLYEMDNSAEDFNELGWEMANREVKEMGKEVGISVPNIKKDVVSLYHNEFLLNEMQASIQGYSVETRHKISRALTDAVIQQKSGYEAVSKVGKYVHLRTWKIRRIVRTEMSRIYNGTKMISYQEFNRDNFQGRMLKRMFHPMDNRTAEDSKLWAIKDPAIPMNQLFRMVLPNGNVQEGLYPPLRPNDRATLLPFLPEK